MINVQIDGAWYKADDPVVKRMQEYYDAMKKTMARLEELTIATRNMRDAQKNYFQTRDSYVLRKSKALEVQVDDLLAGKEKQKEVQSELFR